MSTSTHRIDIVSDVVCPWCIIGYKRLEKALLKYADRLSFELHWHPFELNPDMPPEGQNLREHLAGKYGTTLEESIAAREKLTALGKSLGFEFRYRDDMRTYNTSKAHQLLHWAADSGRQTDLKLALFDAFFTRREDVSSEVVLIAAAGCAGLDPEEARAVLADGRYADVVRATSQRLMRQGIQGVPAFIVDGTWLVSGAQETPVFESLFQRLTEGTAAVGGT
jgi:predicted DsbA family dithiol-disulfide isomerase